MKNIFFFLILLISFSSFSQYYTGQRVFAEKFPQELKDYNQDTYIKVNNVKGDIIVAIQDINLNKVIQHSYILSYQTYTFKNIPVGTYVAKYMWTDSNGNKRFEKDNSSMKFKKNEYGGYEITLEETVNGNLSQSSISENEFFN